MDRNSPGQPSRTMSADLVDVRRREVVASFRTYREAEAAVDALADSDFPVQHLSIVAEDLTFVERVTGRRAYSHAMWDGMQSGVLVGALLGFFFGLFDWVQPIITGLALALYGALIGAVIGGIVGAASHGFSRGRRDFSSIGAIEAGNYVVLADAEVREEATERLRSGSSPAPSAAGG